MQETESIHDAYMNSTVKVRSMIEKFESENGETFASLQKAFDQVFAFVWDLDPATDDGECEHYLEMQERLYEMRLSCEQNDPDDETNFWTYHANGGTTKAGSIEKPMPTYAVGKGTPELLCDWLNQRESWLIKVHSNLHDRVVISLKLRHHGRDACTKITFCAVYDGSACIQNGKNAFTCETVSEGASVLMK